MMYSKFGNMNASSQSVTVEVWFLCSQNAIHTPTGTAFACTYHDDIGGIPVLLARK